MIFYFQLSWSQEIIEIKLDKPFLVTTYNNVVKDTLLKGATSLMDYRIVDDTLNIIFENFDLICYEKFYKKADIWHWDNKSSLILFRNITKEAGYFNKTKFGTTDKVSFRFKDDKNLTQLVNGYETKFIKLESLQNQKKASIQNHRR